MISSDWNECLAPCGPFDAIAFSCPDLAPELTAVFRRYTGNEIPLSKAAETIASLMPRPLTVAQMDAYLESAFDTYTGVSALIRWADANDVLFMINTTGMIGYFQRALASGKLPPVPALAAHPLIGFPASSSDPAAVFELLEIEDKARHTEAVARRFSIPFSRVAIMGDSGGDGPHFAWAAKNGAATVGCMTKASLNGYCRRRGIHITLRFGPSCEPGEDRNEAAEKTVDFTGLIPFLEKKLLSR